MNYKLTYIFIFLYICLTTYGQKCVDTDLSNNFTFSTQILPKSQKKITPCEIIVTVSDKNTGRIIQTLEIVSEFILVTRSFKNSNTNRSYVTGKNEKVESINNDFGDLIVADFNFDNKDDFAVKREEGGNSGPLYNFYLQTETKTFLQDYFLSNTMMWFPFEIDKNKMTLTNYVRISSLEDEKITYQFDKHTSEWKVLECKKYHYRPK